MYFDIEYVCQDGHGHRAIFADTLTEAVLKFNETKDVKILSITKIQNRCQYCLIAPIPDDYILCPICEEIVYQTEVPNEDHLGRVSAAELERVEKENNRRNALLHKLWGKMG